MHHRAELELADGAAARPPLAARGPGPPPIDQPVMTLGERRDVVLRVAAVDAERVQLEDLARQVLVEAELAAAALRGELARRANSGPIDVWLSRYMSIAGCFSTASSRSTKLPVTCGRIASFSSAPASAEQRRLVGGHGEVVGPEMHEPLAKRRVGDGRDLVAGAGVLHEVVAEDRTVGALRSLGGFGVAGLARHAHLALLVLHVAQDLGRARERGELRRRVGGAQLARSASRADRRRCAGARRHVRRARTGLPL